ncbi:MAG: UvrD-helicase domain-containing protein [Anaerolineae bacterium]|nr:UvrD-helicase domain-containing protein [Anaerolineae bacterium]
MAVLPAPTYGEKLLHRLLRDLPRKQFFFHHEPQLISPDGRSRKPDFVIVSALHGVVVLEVKDWVKLTGGDQRSIHTRRSDGQAVSYDNPVRTAEGYAYDLKRRFEARAELWEQYKGRTRLAFPWQVMVALPRISRAVIQQFEKKGIWPRGVVIGKESLTGAAQLQQAIHALPWTFPLERPLSLDMLDIIREVLNPSLTVENDEGLPIGTLTAAQYGLITEPLHSTLPRQMAMFGDDEDSEETHGLAENAALRLVRGVAGSGKTLVLVRRTRHLAELYPEARLLVLTFNIELARDLRARIGLPEEQARVAHFHQLCRFILGRDWRDPNRARDWLRDHARDALQAQGLTADFVAGEFAWRKELGLIDPAAYLEADRRGRGQRLDRGRRQFIDALFGQYRAHQAAMETQGGGWDWDDVALRTLDVLTTRRHPLRATYDGVLIDEAQDFAPSWIGVARALLKPEGSLFICDDPAQSIFCSYTWPQKGLHIVGRSRVLRVPFRSTREISQAAHSLIEADEGLRATEDLAQPDFASYELGSGPLPVLMACRDREAETAFVDGQIERLLREGLPAGQIAILCHGRWHLDRWAAWNGRGVFVQNIERIKGLEFRAVFLPHLQEVFPRPDDAEAVTQGRRKLFTAMTRARYRLMLSYQGALPKPLEPLLEWMWCESTS